MSNILRNNRYELYAQGVAAGLTKREAYSKAGFRAKKHHAHVALDRRPEVQDRIEELLKASAGRSELSRKQILDRIFDDWNLARKLGQVPAALKAAELMGREMFKMFTERKEVGGPGDFDNKSEDELRQIISDGMKDLGWEKDIIPPNKELN